MHISTDFLATVVELLVVLGIMVLVHEFGHFVAAKLCRVRVEVFSIGFGTRLFGVHYGDTDYRVSLLPLGGYVKMAGDAVGSEPEEGSWNTDEFNGHPRWQRVIIALAGPFANFVLALLLLGGLAMFHNEVEAYRQGAAVADYVPLGSPVAASGLRSGDTIVAFDHFNQPTWEDILDDSLTHLNHTVKFAYTHDGNRVDTTLPLTWTTGGPETFDPIAFGFVPQQQDSPMKVSPTAGSVLSDMPGAEAGLQPGDTLLSFNNYTPHSVEALVPYLQDQKGAPLTLNILRNGQPITLHLTPVLADRGNGTKAYQVGFLPLPVPVIVKNLPLGEAIVQGFERSGKDASLIADVVKGMFTHRVSVRSLSGPIGIGQQVHQAFQLPGWTPIVELMAFISVNLGIFNLLPFPILDGGMILFLIVESLLRRDVNLQVKERVYQVAFVCFVLFFVFVIFNDISRLSLFAKP
jgi:regulator of sigma E protease